MTRWVAPGAVVLLGAGLAVALLQGPAHAVCIPPSLVVEPSSAAAGAAVTVRGEAWFVGCNDTGQGTPEPPDTAVLSVEQNGKVFELGRATADEEYRFTLVVRLPAELQRGEATIIGRGKGGQAQAAVVVTREAELPLTGGGSTTGVAALAALASVLGLLRSRARLSPA